MAEQELTFEDAYRQLADLVKKMEQGALPLAETVAAYEQASKLKVYCEQMLRAAETKIEQLSEGK
ncbi:MAG: exodeoxyribonuclease VII small subunit [Rickettsiales bacterium]|jgi:exodeoxyribonuclease VII small subunit|nr:exodeoxyribonuclease VII small subunit [Rickettsiales bacterium]